MDAPRQSNTSVQPHRRLSFAARTWLLIGAAFAMGWLMGLPAWVHTKIMERAIEDLKRQAESELGPAASIDETMQWLQQRGFTVSGPGPYYRSSGIDKSEAGQSIYAELGLANGSALWRPATAKALFYFGHDGSPRESDWDLWRFPGPGFTSSSVDELIPKLSGVPLLLVIAAIAYRAVRRDVRFQHGTCRECGYPVGKSPVCTECGKPINGHSN